jgi:pimeloyl-ACP methyl ester carboxylesterase
MSTSARLNFDREKPAGAFGLSRRRFFATAAATAATMGAFTLAQGLARAAIVRTDISRLPPYGDSTLPAGIRSRTVDNRNGLMVHMLEAGFEDPGRPCVLLLHGFPELAYSWRKVMLPLASAGYHVVAPDQRGYGRTTGWDDAYDADPDSFSLLNMVRDAMGLVFALGYGSVSAIVGHDAGSPVASWCALVRPDIFRSVALMSSPFAGPPKLGVSDAPAGPSIDDQLAALDPPRKYYRRYYATRQANDDMMHAPQGLHDFLRAYYHYKSADWKQNKPFRLKSASAEELAKIPTYYVMEKDKNMPETVAAQMPSATEIAACKWLTEDELNVYVGEYGRTGFQGALQGYRVRRAADSKTLAELQTYSGRTIDVPSCFIAGKSDWGVYQNPGFVESMRETACTQMLSFNLLEGAGHWVQQEQPEQVNKLLTAFLTSQPQPGRKP